MRLELVVLCVAGTAIVGCGGARKPPTPSCTNVSATCASLGISSGQFDAGCGIIDCGQDRYAGVPFGSNPGALAMMTTPDGVVVAYTNGDSQLHLAHELSDGGFLDESLGILANRDLPPVIQRTTDGRLWVASASSLSTATPGVDVGVLLATPLPDGGHFGFTHFALPDQHFGFAVDGAGAIHFGYQMAQYDPNTQQFNLRNAHHAVGLTDGGLTDEVVESVVDGGATALMGPPTLVADMQGHVHAFYLVSGSGGELHHASIGASGNTVETVGAPGGFHDVYARPAVAVDGAGNLHAAWANGNDGLTYSAQTGSGWQVTTTPISERREKQALALDSRGHPSVLSADFEAMNLSSEGMGYWPSEVIVACKDPNLAGFALTYDLAGSLRLAYVCTTQSPSTGRVLRGIGRYPDTYAATCSKAATDLCAKACCAYSPSTQVSCSYSGQTSNGQFGQGAGSPESCLPLTLLKVCGDATQDPSVVQTCDQATATLTCQNGANLTGTSCVQFF